MTAIKRNLRKTLVFVSRNNFQKIYSQGFISPLFSMSVVFIQKCSLNTIRWYRSSILDHSLSFSGYGDAGRDVWLIRDSLALSRGVERIVSNFFHALVLLLNLGMPSFVWIPMGFRRARDWQPGASMLILTGMCICLNQALKPKSSWQM